MFKSVVRFWFSDRGIHRPSRARILISWLTLRPLRYRFTRIVRSLLLMETPEWATRVQARVISGGVGRTCWYDWINPIRWIAWFFGFAFEWLGTRRYYAYGPAIPGVALALAMPALYLTIVLKKDGWRETYYGNLFKTELASENNDLALMALTRLFERNPGRIELRLQRAMLFEKLGRYADARTEMESLAVQNRNSLAAYWLMQKEYPLTDVAKWDDNKHQAFRLLSAISASKENESVFVASRVVLSQYLVGIGANSEAISQMESVCGENCELQLVCSVLHFQIGNDDAAKHWAARAQEGYKKLILVDPTNIELRLKLSKAMLLQGQTEAVALTLSDGYKLTKDDRLLNAGAESLVAWAARLEKEGSPTPAVTAKRLSLLARAAELAPKNNLVLETLVNTVIQCAESKDPQVVNLREVLIQKLDADKMHFIQGTIALMQGDIEQADGHLQLASTNSGNVPGVLNNLAVVLYQQDAPDLERALALVNAALRTVPDQPQIRETRGQIYLRLKQYQEAIFDLEFALAAKESPQAIHKSLAQAYEAIGLVDLAKSHSEMAAN